MHDLVKLATEAYGGSTRWKQLRAVSAVLRPDGPSSQSGLAAVFANGPVQATIDTRMQRTALEPFLAEGQRAINQPGRAMVETLDGTLIEELRAPAASAHDAVWSAPQLAYFAGEAMSAHLTGPFSLLSQGVECEEIEPRLDGDQTWRALRATFPASYVAPSIETIFFFDHKGLIRRLDYVINRTKVVHYLDRHLKFGGIFFATRCRIYPQGPDGKPDTSAPLASLELTDFKFAEDTGDDDIADFRDRFMAGIYEC
jgi:hypothetical protein